MKLPPNTVKQLEEVAFTGSLKYRRVRYYYHKVVRCLVWKPTMPETPKNVDAQGEPG